MTAYYNEIDPHAAQWLRNLIAAGHIAAGDVDERSIEDVYPDDLRGYTQCHFFAGIGVWSHALRRAGFPDDRPVWTGSCPCQPFSAAGKGAGFTDERHLWPAFYHLVAQCRPSVVFGEQVASPDGLAWFDLVQADLEASRYACGAVDICASGFGAPHIRQRLYWVAHANDQRLEGRKQSAKRAVECAIGARSVVGRLAHASNVRFDGRRTSKAGDGRDAARIEPERFCDAGGLADTELQQRPHGQPGISALDDQGGRLEGSAATAGLCSDMRPGPTNGYWRNADWIGCRDGKWRPVEPDSSVLASGVAGRVVKLRALGNAICAPVAEEFIRAAMSAIDTAALAQRGKP